MESPFVRVALAVFATAFLMACSDGPGSGTDSDSDNWTPDTAEQDSGYSGCAGLDRSQCGNTRGCRWRCGACESGDADVAHLGCPSDAGDAVDGDAVAGDVEGAEPQSSEHFEWVRYEDGEFGRSVYLDVTVGPDGGVFVAGAVQSPPGQPTLDDVARGGIVVKIAPDGTYQWAHHVESAGGTRLTALTVDDSGTVYAVGWGDRGSGDPDFWSDHTAYMLELSPDGDLEGRHEILGSATVRPKELDSLDGDLIVAGDGQDFEEPAGEGQDAFLARLDPAGGEARWITVLGGDRLESAKSMVTRDAGDIRISMPVVRTDRSESPADGKLYAITADGEVNQANSLPLPGALFNVGLRDGDIFLGGFAEKSEEIDLEAFVAGGTPVYPTSRFRDQFGTDEVDRVTDLAVEAEPAAWSVGPRKLDRGKATSEAFAVRHDRDGERTHEIVFGDAHETGVTPWAVSIDEQGNIYVAGGTRATFEDGEPFGAQATFVGKLRPESGP